MVKMNPQTWHSRTFLGPYVPSTLADQTLGDQSKDDISCKP